MGAGFDAGLLQTPIERSVELPVRKGGPQAKTNRLRGAPGTVRRRCAHPVWFICRDSAHGSWDGLLHRVFHGSVWDETPQPL